MGRQLGLTASIQLVYPFIRRCQGISFEDSNKKKIMADKKNIIQVKLGDFSVLDSEFNSIRERFDAEMRKMEDEMTKFRSELLNREQSSSVFSKSSTTTSSSTSTSNSSNLHSSEARKWIGDVKEQMTSSSSLTSSASQLHSALTPPSASSDWLTGLHSPLIQEDGEEKKLKLRFDVSQYTPEEIVVKTVDQKLLVHAKHEEKTDTKSVYREYNREFLLPKGTNPEMIRSSLSKDGVLTIEAPLPALASGEKLIPIAH